MIDDKGKVRCDAEIGNVERGWHSCNKLAVCESRSEHGFILHWCETHRSRATMYGRQIVREIGQQ